MSPRPIVLTLALALALTAAGCPSSEPAAPAAGQPEGPAGATPSDTRAAPPPDASIAVEGREVPVKCGCKLEVKKCSEWAEVDGRWVRLVGDHGMGSMPFCGKEGLKARVSGQLQGDELRFTALEMVP